MKTLLVDIPFLCHRSLHATNNFSKGEQGTGIIYGTLLQIKTLMEKFKTNDLIFCWDGLNSKRKELYPQYKSRRKTSDPVVVEQNEQAYKQFKIIQEEVIPAMGFINNFRTEGYEADDIMAQISLSYEKDFIMVTADNDMFQMLDMADMFSPATNVLYTMENFIKEHGIVPKDWAKVKALAGCKSDNVIGLEGIGNKSAVKWINNSLEKHLKTYQILKEGEKQILKQNLPLVELPFKDTPIYRLKKGKTNYKGLLEIVEKYGMDSFINGHLAQEWRFLLQ